MPSIIDLPRTISSLKQKDSELLDRLFIINEKLGEMVLPEQMKPWASENFKDWKNVERQKIVSVFNKLSFEGALFNELRSMRPMAAKSDEDSAKAIKESEGDPFCRPLQMTPADTFGRIKGKHCITASNVAKYDGLHGLVVFSRHNPLVFDRKEVIDYLETAAKWFKAAHKSSPDSKYPFLLWNCLWKSGASLIHGHMQMVLSEEFHYADAEHLNSLRMHYSKKYSSDYFEDLFSIHEKLSLGFRHRKLRIFTSITPRKDKEITILGQEPDKAFAEAVYQAAACLRDDLGSSSFNVGIILRPMDSDAQWTGFPVVARVVDRGKLSAKTADVGGMEMYAKSAVIETDPYKVIECLRKRF